MAENQEIFDNAKITELALKWKALTAENRHGDAMPILEEIIKLCEQMFLRLAQYEGFTHTVDLSTLVQSAREKVPRWLLGWDPTYKSNNGIFSWFSKSLSGNTLVRVSDGSAETLKSIVDRRKKVSVTSWCEESEEFVNRAVTHWHKETARPDLWRRLTVSHGCGFSHSFDITYDHEVLTPRGWVEVQDLAPTDTLYAQADVLTAFGRSAVVGLYLAGAAVDRAGNLKIVCDTRLADVLKLHFAATCTVKKSARKNEVTIGGKFMTAAWDLLPRKKQVSPQVLSKLDPVGLAYWFFAAGVQVVDSGAFELTAPGVSTAGLAKLVECLSINFGINARRDGTKIVVDDHDAASVFGRVVFKFSPRCETRLVTMARVPVTFSVSRLKPSRLHAWKYDVTVDGTENFTVASDTPGVSTVVSNCAKHAFLSEIAKLNQHRKRFHATGDNLEKFFGAEDHSAFKDEAATEVRRKLADISVRWGDPQEIGCVRYILECLVEDREDTKADKEVIIRSASLAWCVSLDLTTFFYDWALFALRDALHAKIHVPFTQQDLYRNRESYTFLVDMIDIVGWDRFKRLLVTMGGQRIRLPTLQQLARLHNDYLMNCEIDKSDLDPDSVEKIGKKHGRSAKTAGELYEELAHTNSQSRSGEFSLYPAEDDHHDRPTDGE